MTEDFIGITKKHLISIFKDVLLGNEEDMLRAAARFDELKMILRDMKIERVELVRGLSDDGFLDELATQLLGGQRCQKVKTQE